SRRYELSERLVRLYEKIATPGRAQFCHAQMLESWAKARLPAQPMGLPDFDPLLDHTAPDLFRQAGARYEASALPQGPAAERCDRVWHAFQCYLQGYVPGKESDAAGRVLKQLAGLGQFRDRIGEGWYQLAEARRAVREEESALQAFRECVEQPGKF